MHTCWLWLIGMMSFASFSNLEADKIGERRQQEINALNSALKNLQESTGHPSLPQGILEGDEHVANEIETVCHIVCKQ